MARSDSPDETIDRYLADIDIEYEFVAEPSFEDTQLDNGAVFWFARWSVPAVCAMKKLASLLSKVDLPDMFVFRILDIDEVQNYYSHYNSYEIIIGGNGECFWFVGASVIGATFGADYDDAAKACGIIRKNFSM